MLRRATPKVPREWQGLSEQRILDILPSYNCYEEFMALWGPKCDLPTLSTPLIPWAAGKGYTRLLLRLAEGMEGRGAFGYALSTAISVGSVECVEELTSLVACPPPSVHIDERWFSCAVTDAAMYGQLDAAERLLQACPLSKLEISPFILQRFLEWILPSVGPFVAWLRGWHLVLTASSDLLPLKEYAMIAHIYPRSRVEGFKDALYKRRKDVPVTSAEERLALIREAAWKRRRHLCLGRALWRKPAVKTSSSTGSAAVNTAEAK
jgi:hypothetical protein